jgi:excinuclease UvrABC nuclease subunit
MASKPLTDIPDFVHFERLPKVNQSGIYRLHLDGEIVYVGQAKCLRRRIGQHLAEGFKQFDSASYIFCTPNRLDGLERYFIRYYAPRLNNCSVAKEARRINEMGFEYDMPKPPTKASRRAKRRVHLLRIVEAKPS